MLGETHRMVSLQQAQDPLEAAASRLRSAQPNISDACKNYLSLLMAGDLVGREIGREGQGSSAEDSSPPLDHATLMQCAKVTLRALNACTLLSEAGWQEKYPQGEEESASDRLTAVLDYRAAVLLRAAIAKKEGKITKLFGRNFMQSTHCWEPIADQVKTELESSLPSSAAAAATIGVFLDGWSRAMASPSSDTSEHWLDCELVWTNDLKKLTKERAERRKLEAQARVSRMGEASAQHSLLEQALASSAGAAEEDETD